MYSAQCTDAQCRLHCIRERNDFKPTSLQLSSFMNLSVIRQQEKGGCLMIDRFVKLKNCYVFVSELFCA